MIKHYAICLIWGLSAMLAFQIGFYLISQKNDFTLILGGVLLASVPVILVKGLIFALTKYPRKDVFPGAEEWEGPHDQ